MYEADVHSVRSGNTFTLTLTTPVPEKEGKEPGDYEGLINKPRIDGIEIIGNMQWTDFGIPDLTQLPEDISEIPTNPLSDEDLDELINS